MAALAFFMALGRLLNSLLPELEAMAGGIRVFRFSLWVLVPGLTGFGVYGWLCSASELIKHAAW